MQYEITVHEVKGLPSGAYRVSVFNSEKKEVESEHVVRVDEGYVYKLGWEAKKVSDLVRESFQFLLKRETPEEILKEFDLQAIANYFPEYEEKIRW